jgi:hypothetical protein
MEMAFGRPPSSNNAFGAKFARSKQRMERKVEKMSKTVCTRQKMAAAKIGE